MSKGERLFIGIMFLLLGISALCSNILRKDLEARLTALEQSQCSIKQEIQHADYKLDVCMKQLRSKP